MIRARSAISGEVRTFKLTTEHAASSYGQAILVDARNGEAVDLFSWAFYELMAAADRERAALRQAGYPCRQAERSKDLNLPQICGMSQGGLSLPASPKEQGAMNRPREYDSPEFLSFTDWLIETRIEPKALARIIHDERETPAPCHFERSEKSAFPERVRKADFSRCSK